MKDRGSPERWDLETLGLSVAVVPLVWLALLGWSSHQSIGASDQVAQTLPLVKDLFEHAHGDFTRMSYRVELLGGAKVHDVFGILPIFSLLAWLGASPVFAVNAVLFLTQIACAFFGVRLAYDVARLMSGKLHRPAWLSRLGVVLLTAFSPTLAWRMTTGHYEEVFGALLGVTVVALSLAYRNKTFSLTLALMTVVVDLEAFQTKGQELVYGAVFFGLVIVACFVPLRPRRALAVPLLLTVGSFALSMPRLAGMFAHAESSDAARALGGASVVYSYVTATVHDWLASIPWGFSVIPTDRDVGFWHEINFGFGPMLALLALLPWRKHRLLGAGLAVSLVLPVLFSANAPGVAWVLTHACPPLAAFRVPERAVLAFALVLPAFASAGLLLRSCPRLSGRWAAPAIAFGGGAILFIVPADLREVLAWAIPLAIVFRPLFQWTLPARIPTAPILVILGLGSLSAFKERLRPYADEESLIESPARIAEQMRQTKPELSSPLSRIVMHFDLDGYQTNTAYVMGLSSLSGYLNPPRRFLALEAALSGTEENLLRNYFRLDETVPSFGVLQQLYNVEFAAFPEPKKLRLSPLGDTAGRAWFSARLTRVPTMRDLAVSLHAAMSALSTEAHRQAWVVTSDEAVAAAGLPEVVSGECARAVVRKTDAAVGTQSVRLDVYAPAACPLTIAMTFTTDLVAIAGNEALTVYPSYGALTGVWAPEGESIITVEARPIVPWWSRVAWFFGFALVAAAFLETCRLCREQRRAPEGRPQ